MHQRPPPELLPEERFLLAIGKLDPSAEDRALVKGLVADTDFSWDKVLALAVLHRVHPMLAYNLENDDGLGRLLPEETSTTLRGFRVAAAMRTALYDREVAPMLEALTAEKIPVALMKGAAIAKTLYPPGTRLLNDFDILIHKHHYPRVAAVFTASGFLKVIREGRTEASELESYHQIALVKRVGQAVLKIDLHWLMYPPERAFCQIDTPSLMSRARSIQFGATSAFVLSPEDMLVHYASQLVNDSLRVGCLRMGDIYAIAKSLPSWESTVETATRAGAAGATHLALSIAAMLGASVPPRVFRQLRHVCVGCDIASEYLAVPSLAFRRGIAPDAAQPILVSLLYSRLGDRIAYLRSRVAAGWRASRRQRGTVRSGFVAAHRIGQGALWLAGRLAPRPEGRRRTVAKEPAAREAFTL